MAVRPTEFRFLKLTSKGKLKPNPIDVAKLTPSELKKYGLLEDSEKGLTKDKGLVPRGSRKLYRRAKLGGLVGRNKVMKGYKKGGQV
jgi:hypothetical protein|tara:strand:+ start:659 stop:919 length:261 start_codon:yes stop_codon:yes gene_type:complete